MPRRGTAILLTLLTASWAATPANGYRFFARHGALHRIASVAGAIRWDASAFPLRFRLLENDNLPRIAGLDGEVWRESVERGFQAWTEIETSRLEVALTDETLVAEQGRAADAVLTIGFSSNPDIPDGLVAYAVFTHSRGHITDCDIHFRPGLLNHWDDDPEVLDTIADYLALLVMHEVGHCLGLAHSAMNPTWLARPGVGERAEGFYPDGATSLQPHPRMSYGTNRQTLEPDDAVAGVAALPGARVPRVARGAHRPDCLSEWRAGALRLRNERDPCR